MAFLFASQKKAGDIGHGRNKQQSARCPRQNRSVNEEVVSTLSRLLAPRRALFLSLVRIAVNGSSVLEEDFSTLDIALTSSNMKRLASIRRIRSTCRSSCLAEHVSYLRSVVLNGDQQGRSVLSILRVNACHRCEKLSAHLNMTPEAVWDMRNEFRKWAQYFT